MNQKSRFGFRQMTYGVGMDESEPMVFIDSVGWKDDAIDLLPAPKKGNYWQFIMASSIKDEQNES